MRILLLGATGTIGLATCKALLEAGHSVTCLLRDKAGVKGQSVAQHASELLAGAEIRVGDVQSVSAAQVQSLRDDKFDAIVSCMASRTGTPKDAWAIDYQAHSQWLKAAQAAGIGQFVLLSAICVQKPLLAFQQAKLAFEKELTESGLVFSIVRPTAFFKSLSGQIERINKDKSFLVFGHGELTSCKPISDQDLANFIASCLTDPAKHNQILPIGGPGNAITPLQQGEYLFKLFNKKSKFTHVPVTMLDVIIHLLRVAGWIVPSLKDKAELAAIGRYYATESMLVWDPKMQRYDADATPCSGTQTLFDHYDQLAAGGAKVQLGDHAVFS